MIMYNFFSPFRDVISESEVEHINDVFIRVHSWLGYLDKNHDTHLSNGPWGLKQGLNKMNLMRW
jgi:hypothetical protein